MGVVETKLQTSIAIILLLFVASSELTFIFGNIRLRFYLFVPIILILNLKYILVRICTSRKLIKDRRKRQTLRTVVIRNFVIEIEKRMRIWKIFGGLIGILFLVSVWESNACNRDPIVHKKRNEIILLVVAINLLT